jgi:integrase
MPNQRRRTRRVPGAGHLFTRRSRAGEESWYGQWYAPDGRRIKRRVGPKRSPGSDHGLTRREAEAKLRRMMGEAIPPARGRLTLADAAAEHLQGLRALGRKPSTVEAVESAARVHLVPHFDGRPVERIEVADVEEFIAAKLADGYAPKSVRNYVGTLGAILEPVVAENPVRSARQPERNPSGDIRFLTLEELEATIAAESDDDLGPTLRVLYLAAAMTGMRRGELIALRWLDVDWTARKIRVRRNYTRSQYGTPKSRRSSRSVPLADRLAGELDRHYQGSHYQGDEDLVFGHPHLGTPLDGSKIRKRFQASLRRAGVRRVRFHDLRHTFGTRMAADGAPLRSLQEWMGHASIKTTEVYADYSPSEHEAEWVERAFSRGATGGATQGASRYSQGLSGRLRTQDDPESV